MKNRFYKEYQEKDIQAFEYTKKLQKENEETELNLDEGLYNKLDNELKEFHGNLLEKGKEEILNSAYEITVKEQIRDILKEMNLHEVEKEILFLRDDLLTELYQDWLHHDSSLREPITDSVDKSISTILRNFRITDKER
ncbi:MAG: DUF3848 domain-containing protein [Clostridia bacterium]|nr:DUF3848 domain-containing protein [Clostridia bacterium]